MYQDLRLPEAGRMFGLCSPVVQKILIRNGLASQFDRYLHLEEKHLKEGIPLTEEQIRKIEKFNPCFCSQHLNAVLSFAERHVESSRPGELLCQDTKLIGTLSGIGRVYLHALVDSKHPIKPV